MIFVALSAIALGAVRHKMENDRLAKLAKLKNDLIRARDRAAWSAEMANPRSCYGIPQKFVIADQKAVSKIEEELKKLEEL
jgi:hypothetical protein